MKKIIVIGGGPAGIMAALTAANGGAEVALWERNKSLGRKLAITGKGRCNITNMADTKDLVKNMPGNGSFSIVHLLVFLQRTLGIFLSSMDYSLKLSGADGFFHSL